MKNRFKKFKESILIFFRKYGIDAFIALPLFYSPSILAFFIPSMKDFGVAWAAFWSIPIITPAFIAIPLTAFIVHFIRMKLWKLILFLRDQLDKIKMTNELLAYISRDELKVVLVKFKSISKFSYKEKEKFNIKHNKERLELLKGSWEKLE